jgi:CheY-like chemotaxis protein
MGLGLFSLAKRVEVLKGKFGMHKRADGRSGSCFWFSFPYIPDETALFDQTSRDVLLVSDDCQLSTKSLPANIPSLKASDMTDKVVLLVDDSTLILKTTSRMLKKMGFDVVTAQNGEEGLRLMQSNRYYFVLSDIQMPVMDGVEMVRRIRQWETTERKQGGGGVQLIIGMSANSDAETRDESLACGMNAFIPKPVRIGELLKNLPP